MERASSLSAVVPVYNAQGTLERVYEELSAALEASTDAWEIVLVNDGSADRSWPEIVALTKQDGRVRGLDLARNSGQHAALLCGIRSAAYPLILTLDDDLQYPPAELPRLLEGLEESVDLVYGRAPKEEREFWRRFGSGFIRWGLGIAVGTNVAREASPFRLFRASLRKAFEDFHGPYVSVDVLLSWGARSTRVVEVTHRSREAGRSSYTLRRLILHALDLITGYSTLPLQVASLLGLLFTLFGCGVLMYVVGRYLLEGGSVPGFPFLASIVSIFAGVQLLTLGIFGQYLGRIHQRSLDRPAYVVREVAGG